MPASHKRFCRQQHEEWRQQRTLYRAAQVLPEKEARVITAQVCSGLAYLNNTPRRIIHMVSFLLE